MNENKINVAYITSVNGLRDYASLSDIHMSLAHLVLENETYAQYYKTTDKFVIMDNSAFEFEQQGRGVPIDKVLEAANRIEPDEICVTDVLFNGEETLYAVKDFMNYVKKSHKELLGNTKFMAIPQGKSEDEWMACYEQLVIQDDIQTIGLSKLSVPESFYGNHHESGNCTKGRNKCINTLVKEEMEPFRWNKETHLLGSDDRGVSELRSYYERGYNEWIRSNDTSMPFVYGLSHSVINDITGEADNIIMEKLDFNGTYTKEDMEFIDDNFLIWRTINVN